MNNSFNPYFANTQCPPFGGNYGWNAPSYGGFTGNYGWNGPTYWNQPQNQSQSCSTPSWWGNGSTPFAQNNTNNGPCESMPTWDTNAA